MDDLTAAIPVQQTADSLSTEEFQGLLKEWFKEKGLMSDIKTHLRFKMIEVLKNTVVGKDLVKKYVQQTSLSQQAISMIVAEFLLQNQFYYSLSLFSTEAKVVNICPDYSSYKIENKPRKELFKLDYENFLNIMELIGLSKMSDECKEIVNLYYGNTENCSVLLCLIQLLGKISNKQMEVETCSSYVDLTNESPLIKEIGKILVQYKVTPSKFNSIIHNMKLLYNSELKTLHERYHKTIVALQTEANSYDDRLKQMQKVKQLLEDKFKKMYREHRHLKRHLKQNTKQSLMKKESQEKDDEVVCRLKHCDENCSYKSCLVENLKRENEELLRKNKEQTEEINTLTLSYKNIVKDFLDCQKKIDLLNSRLTNTDMRTTLQEILLESNSSRGQDQDSSRSSDSITEKVLNEARIKLKQLEEESKYIETNYQQLQISLETVKL